MRQVDHLSKRVVINIQSRAYRKVTDIVVTAIIV